MLGKPNSGGIRWMTQALYGIKILGMKTLLTDDAWTPRIRLKQGFFQQQ